MQLQPVAFSVPISDVGGYYTGTNVEAALQEIGAGTVGGVTNWTEATNVAAPNNTVGATSWSALSSLADADAVIIPKRDGAILAAVPDGLAAGGNKRGLNAVDLQLVRAANTDVAANRWSAIVGGQSNRCAGNNGFIGGGNNNLVSDTDAACIGGRNNSINGGPCSAIVGGGDSSGHTLNGTGAFIGGGSSGTISTNYCAIIGGQGGTLSGTGAVMLGGSNATLSGASSVGIGEAPADNGVRNSMCHGIPRFAVGNPAQFIRVGLKSLTTDATATAMTVEGGAASTGNQLIIPNSSAVVCRGRGIARQNTTGDTYAFEFVATVSRDANAASTTLDASTVTDLFRAAGAAAWVFALSADTTNGGLRCTFTGEAAKTIRTVVFIDSVMTVG